MPALVSVFPLRNLLPIFNLISDGDINIILEIFNFSYLLFLLLICSCLDFAVYDKKQGLMFPFSVQHFIVVHLVYSSKYYTAPNLILFTFGFFLS